MFRKKISLLISFITFLFITNSFSQIDPYLQAVSPNSIHINWIYSEETSKVIYGTSPDNLENEVIGSYDDFCNYNYHSIKLENLAPNTKYYYKVISGNLSSDVFSFKTLPNPGEAVTQDGHIRLLILGDNQLNNERYEKFVRAAKKKVIEKYGSGSPDDAVTSIFMVGDQVDAGTCSQYANIHFAHNKEISPYVPIHTLLGNHEVSAMFGLAGLGGEKEIGYYRDFFILDEEEILYKPELYPEAKFRTENFYAKQIGNILYIGFDTEFNNTVDTQYEWMQRIMEAANNDPTVDWILSGGHRPYGAEQYPTDINLFIRDRAVPYLAQFDKYVMHIGAHHHLYSRGQLKDKPVYHIISGGTAWDQYWGDSKEEDMPDIQKTLTEWAYQIVDIDVNKGTFNVESYSIGTVNGYYEQDKLIDSFHRYKNKNKPEQPTLTLNNTKDLPINAFVNFIPGSGTNETLNSTEFVISKTEDFARIEKQIYRDFENWFGRGERKDITVNQNENVDIKTLKLRSDENANEYTLSNGTYYIKGRTRDKNLEWSEWSEIKTFTITNSTPATPELTTDKTYYQLQDDQIITNFSNSSTNSYAWAGIYTPSQKPGGAFFSNKPWAWDYTNGAENGSIIFKNPGTASGNIKYDFEPGIYFAFLSKKYTATYIAHSPSFYVGPIVELSTNKLEYNIGEEMILQYNNAPVLDSDVKGYISIYKKGKINPIKTESIGEQQNNTITITGLEKGYYYAETHIEVVTPSNWSIEKGIKTKMQIGNIVNFKVGEGIITELFLDKGQGTEDNPSIYKLNETITPHWENAPGIIKDWIGIYKEGYTPDQSTNPNSGYSYTYFDGLSKGSIAIPSKNLPKEPGRYYMSIFTNDTYKEVSNRVHFTVVDCSPKATVSATATEICAGEDATFEIIGTASSVVTYEINGDTSSTTLNSEGKATITINKATTSQEITLTNIRENLLGCENALTGTATITILPKSTPVFDQIPAICKGTDFSLPTTSTNGITGTWSPSIDNTKTTEYTFTPDETCAKTVTMTVMVNDKVTPTFDQIAPICKGTDFTLPATSTNGIKGTWSPQINNTKTTEYTFTPDETCAMTVTMTVMVNDKVTPTFEQIAPICKGTDFSLPTTSTNGITGIWSPQIDNTKTTEYTFTPDETCAKTVTMTVMVNDKVTPTFEQIAPICKGTDFSLPTTSTNGITGIWSPQIDNTKTTEYTFTPDETCAKTVTMTVMVNDKVTPTFEQIAPICKGTDFSLPTTSTNGITGIWSPQINNTKTTEYTFTPDQSCASTVTMSVRVKEKITPAFDQIAPICKGTDFSLPTTSTNGITGTWSPSIDNTKTTEYTFTPDQSCANTVTMSVMVKENITPTFEQIAPICKGTAFSLPTTSTNGITGTWSPQIDNTKTSEYTFTPDETCAKTVTMTVMVNDKVTPTFEQIAPICKGTDFSLPTTSTNGITGTWSPSIDNTKTTEYTFTPDETCAKTVTMTVMVNDKVTPTFEQVAPICKGTDFTLPATSTNGITGTWSPQIDNTKTTEYTFTPDETCAMTVTMTVMVNDKVTPTFEQIAPICKGTAFSLPTTSTNGITGTWSPSIDNTKTTEYTFTPDQSCANTVTMSVMVKEKITPTFEQIAPICKGTAFSLPTTSTNGITGTWSPSIDNTKTTEYTFTPDETCAKTVTMTVMVNDKVIFNPGISATITICKEETPTKEDLFNALQGNPDEGGMWTNEGNIYIYTIGSNMPCSQVASSTITVIKDDNAPHCDSDNDGITNENEILLGTNPNNKDTDYDNIVDLEEVNNISDPRDTDSDGVIDALESNILDKDDDGLVDQIDVDNNDPCIPDISPKCKIEFTQIVTPNGDNINDILKLEFLKNYPSNKVSIFNKSGKVVFSEENYGNNKEYFKGYGESSFLNKKLPAGVYFYIIEFHNKNGKLIEKSGYFYLLY